MPLPFGTNEGPDLDIGYGRPMQLSSVFKGLANPFQLFPAGMAGGYAIHTDYQKNPFLIVDLESIRLIRRIRVFNFGRHAQRAIPLAVSISDDGQAWREVGRAVEIFGDRTDGAPLDIPFAHPRPQARYVRLMVEKETYLSLDYIEISAPTPNFEKARLLKFDTSGKDILAEYSHFNSGGFSWTFTLTLTAIKQCLANGIVISRVDYSLCLAHFKDRPGTDLYPVLFTPPVIASRPEHLKNIAFNQHDVYGLLALGEINHYAKLYFTPSDRVAGFAQELVRKYDLDPANTLAMVYRGTDKNIEIPPAPIEHYIAVARAAQRRHPGIKIIIQTDQEQVLKTVLEALPDAIFFEELPVTSGSKVMHQLAIKDEFRIGKTDFAIRMLAVTHLLSGMKYVVTHTGNIGFWLAVYRGRDAGLYQFDKQATLRGPGGTVIEDLAGLELP